MAMRFSPEDVKPANTREFFRVALADLKTSQDSVARCYESLTAELKPSMLQSLNEVGEKFDNKHGWGWLRKEAQRLSSKEPSLSKMPDGFGLRLLIGEAVALNLEMEARRLDQLVGRI